VISCSAVFAVLAEIWLLMAVLLNSSMSAVLPEPISAVLSCWRRDVLAGRWCSGVYRTSVLVQSLAGE